jgi:phosphate uptake regulator
VDIIEEGSQLIINAKKNSNEGFIKIDMDQRIPILWKYISTAYREGFEEIILEFSEPNKKYENIYGYLTPYSKDQKFDPSIRKNILGTAQDFANRFIGMEIIGIKDNSVIIKQIDESSDKQFENVMKRIFFIMEQLFEDLISSVDESQYSKLKDFHEIDVNIDRFHDFCCRILNKTGSKTPQKSQLIFTTLFILELLSDEFKRIADIILKDGKMKHKEFILKTIKAIYEQFKIFHDLYYHFDDEKVTQTYEKSFGMFKDFEKIYSQKTPMEKEVLYSLRKMSELIYSLVELRIEIDTLRKL